MRDKLLTYAIAGSIVVHLVLLGLVGTTSAARPIQVDVLKVVKVDLVKLQDESKISHLKPDQAEPPKPKVEAAPPDVPYVPPVKAMVTQDKVKHTKPTAPIKWPVDPNYNPPKTNVATQPGNSGGPLTGIGSQNGQDMGNTGNGNSSVGTVPGSDNGHGNGSGNGPGTGTVEPPVNNHPGTNDPPVVVIPPQPKMVKVTICAASGMLPGPYCEKKEERSFKEGAEPTSVCKECKAPFVPTIADRKEPELEKDCKPNIPALDDSGNYVVKVRYTVNKDGSVSNVEVVESSGIPAIDRAIKEAASKLRYKPAIQNGEPRSVSVNRRYSIST
jgi:TonB family protein